MEYFSPVYGLVTEPDPITENGQLFLADYIFILDAQGNTVDSNASRLFYVQLNNSFAGESGLYHRNPQLTYKTMSHDNLSAIFAWSKFAGTSHRFAIWKYLVNHLGTYDNTKGVSKQFSRFLPFNPANFFIWGLSADSKLAYLFLPFFLINLLITCNKKVDDTSGKIILSVELYPLMDNPIVKLAHKYYHNKMTKQYGSEYDKALRAIYHASSSSEFPIKKALGI